MIGALRSFSGINYAKIIKSMPNGFVGMRYEKEKD